MKWQVDNQERESSRHPQSMQGHLDSFCCSFLVVTGKLLVLKIPVNNDDMQEVNRGFWSAACTTFWLRRSRPVRPEAHLERCPSRLLTLTSRC